MLSWSYEVWCIESGRCDAYAIYKGQNFPVVAFRVSLVFYGLLAYVQYTWMTQKMVPLKYSSIHTSPTITVSPSLTPSLMRVLFTPQASKTCWNLLKDSVYLNQTYSFISKLIRYQSTGEKMAKKKTPNQVYSKFHIITVLCLQKKEVKIPLHIWFCQNEILCHH